MTKRTKSKTRRLLETLQSGRTVTIKQAQARFGFETPNSVTGAISALKRQGYRVFAEPASNGVVRYTI